MISFVSFVMVLLTIHSATSLNCYNCNSQDSSICKWGGITSLTYGTQQCDTAGILDSIVGAKCYKITARKDGEEFVARGCQNPPAFGCSVIAKGIGFLADMGHTDVRCEVCDTDKCNSASKVAGFTLLGILLAAFAFLF